VSDTAGYGVTAGILGQPGANASHVDVLAVVRAAYRRHPRWMTVLALVAVAILVLAYGGYFLGWDWTGFKGNTFWDWLSLLITPVTIASVSILFSMQQGRASMDASERQRQDAMLEAYFDHINHLVVDQRLPDAPAESAARAMARARTMATLERASSAHRSVVLRFLEESGLTTGDNPVVDLHGVATAGLTSSAPA
jgi:hypothetical protein